VINLRFDLPVNSDWSNHCRS